VNARRATRRHQGIFARAGAAWVRSLRGDSGHLTAPARALPPWSTASMGDGTTVSGGGRARRAVKGRGPDWSSARPPGGLVLASATAVVALAGLGWLTGSGLRVREVEVVGAQVTDSAVLRRELGRAFGMPLLAVDVDALEEALRRDPWIAGVKIGRRLPDRLHVALEEAQPIFVLAAGQGSVDAAGAWLPPRDGLQLGSLPELAAPRVAPDGPLTREASEAVRRLCAALDRVPWIWPEGLRRVDLDAQGGVELVTGGGALLVLGREGFEKRLRAFGAAAEHLRPGPGDRIDLRFERQIVLQAPPDSTGADAGADGAAVSPAARKTAGHAPAGRRAVSDARRAAAQGRPIAQDGHPSIRAGG
jgi:cell division protein FtsQ